MSVIDFRKRQERIWDAEDVILREIDGVPKTTDAVIASLKRRRFDEYSIRAALWALIGRGDLVLRQERGDVFVARPS